MADIPGVTFNSCFHTLMGKLWLSNQIPDSIIEDDDTARMFMDKTLEAIGFISKLPVPESYKSLYMKTYKDSYGAFLFIQLPDAMKDSDSKVVILMNAGNVKKYYTVEFFGSKYYMCEYKETSKSTVGFMVEGFDDALELYQSFTGSSSSFIS